MDDMRSTNRWMDRDVAFSHRHDAADRQARPGSQPDGTSQQGRGQQQDEATAATAQALMDCYNG
jgi:hypothetical protein